MARGTSPSKDGKFTILKLKSSLLSYILVVTYPFSIERLRSRKFACLSEVFALLSCSS